MKKITILFILSFITSASYGVEKKMKDSKWFKQFNCEKLNIVKYHSSSSKTIDKQVTITDAAYIKSFQNQINNLPASGDKFIKMGPDASYLTLEFSCNSEIEIVQFYQSKIKTPDTSFYGVANGPELEIWQEIQSHFEKPAIGKALPKVKNVIYQFEDFSFEHLGFEDRTPKLTTATLWVESFKVIDKKSKSEQIVEVSSGQLPPAPEKFKVHNENLFVSTFHDKNGARLIPRTFIIYKE